MVRARRLGVRVIHESRVYTHVPSAPEGDLRGQRRHPPANLALVTTGAEWHMSHSWSLMARFDGEFGNDVETYRGTARLRYAW